MKWRSSSVTNKTTGAFSSSCRIVLILTALLAWTCGLAESSQRLGDSYRIQFVTNDEVKVFAQMAVHTGVLVMDGGSTPDMRSANVADLQVTTPTGEEITSSYEPQEGSWKLAKSDVRRINVRYVVHLNSLHALPAWAHLQYGFFDGGAMYLVMKGLIVAPDSTDSTEAATATFSLPEGSTMAAPWHFDKRERVYNTTIAALINNSIVVGKFTQVSYREDDFAITAALLGEWPAHAAAVEKVIRDSVSQDMRLFPGTPGDEYVVTLASGDEDGQSYVTSNAISTRLAISPDDTEIWANTIAHELFHHWDARLIHTTDKRLAFFVEGFTEYYANREILAESLVTGQRYWDMAAFHLGAYSYFDYSPNYGLSIADAGLDKTKNRFGVYDAGWTVALCLDLEVRESSQNHRSLDDLMRLMWQRYGLTGRIYSFEDFVETVSEAAGHDMSGFFQTYIVGKNELPFRRDLAKIGVAAYDQPFGAESYVRVNPHSDAEKLSYQRFMLTQPKR